MEGRKSSGSKKKASMNDQSIDKFFVKKKESENEEDAEAEEEEGTDSKKKKQTVKKYGLKSKTINNNTNSPKTKELKKKGQKSEEKEEGSGKEEEKEEEEEEVPLKKAAKRKVSEVDEEAVEEFAYEDTLEPGWRDFLSSEFDSPYYKKIKKFVASERNQTEVYPPDAEVFNAFNLTPLDQVKVVIIGQDPYFNPNQAHGLCFSVKRGTAVPPSLKRIYKVLENTVPGFKTPKHGCLEEWATRGVLMLNATLTVRKGKANTHASCGWMNFTKAVLQKLNDEKSGLIFFLWGGFAQKLGSCISQKNHHVLQCPHPSPMAGDAFNSCNHFAKANEILKEMGKDPIDWTLSP